LYAAAVRFWEDTGLRVTSLWLAVRWVLALVAQLVTFALLLMAAYYFVWLCWWIGARQ